MKKTLLAFISLAGAALLSGCAHQAPSAPNNAGMTKTATATNVVSAANTNLFSDDVARDSYAVGMYYARGWKAHDVNFNLDMLFRGICDVESNAPTLLTDEQMSQALQQVRQTLALARQKLQAAEAQTNQQEGETFLSQNKTQPGVVTLPDGLQYKIIKDGSGPSPEPYDTVEVNYTGKFVDGTVFDSSLKHYPPGHPAEFPVGRVIPGWTEGLEKMKVGSKWDLYIPSSLAYRSMGQPPLIGPDKTLIFEVELVAIKPAQAPPPPPQPLTSDIIKVPSADEMKNGAQIETIKASDLQKMQQAATN